MNDPDLLDKLVDGPRAWDSCYECGCASNHRLWNRWTETKLHRWLQRYLWRRMVRRRKQEAAAHSAEKHDGGECDCVPQQWIDSLFAITPTETPFLMRLMDSRHDETADPITPQQFQWIVDDLTYDSTKTNQEGNDG